jgi:hypothetical protein
MKMKSPDPPGPFGVGADSGAAALRGFERVAEAGVALTFFAGADGVAGVRDLEPERFLVSDMPRDNYNQSLIPTP